MDAELIENFVGVYMLYCENPQFIGRTYIGYTVNPNRRIKQHNHGVRAGGAYRTSNKGPWVMCMIIHGFPNDVSGLRFEWAWQHPEKSRRLRKLVDKKKTRETRFQYNIRVLSHMLRIGPWNRLGLTVQWLAPKYKVEFPASLQPPVHMPIQEGKVISKKVHLPERDEVTSENTECYLCRKTTSHDDVLACVDSSCSLRAHITCLANHCLKLEPNFLLPLEGSCPVCSRDFLWADVIRKSKGCYQSQDLALESTNIANL